jgi:TetR/AcrR family transcriptional regulator, transcriptional repressor for nem operon
MEEVEMPYPTGHRAQVRERIVRSARELFNRRGFEGTSVDAIMAAAGLTRGGFYSYFKTKEELYAESIRQILADMPATDWDALATNPKAPQILRSIVSAYLSHEALDAIACQCPLVSQPNDVARTGPVARAAYRDVFLFMQRMFEKALEGSGHRDPDLPIGLSALLVGTMTLARTVGDEALAKQIRETGQRLALKMIAPPKAKAKTPRRALANGRPGSKSVSANA